MKRYLSQFIVLILTFGLIADSLNAVNFNPLSPCWNGRSPLATRVKGVPSIEQAVNVPALFGGTNPKYSPSEKRLRVAVIFAAATLSLGIARAQDRAADAVLPDSIYSLPTLPRMFSVEELKSHQMSGEQRQWLFDELSSAMKNRQDAQLALKALKPSETQARGAESAADDYYKRQVVLSMLALWASDPEFNPETRPDLPWDICTGSLGAKLAPQIGLDPRHLPPKPKKLKKPHFLLKKTTELFGNGEQLPIRSWLWGLASNVGFLLIGMAAIRKTKTNPTLSKPKRMANSRGGQGIMVLGILAAIVIPGFFHNYWYGMMLVYGIFIIHELFQMGDMRWSTFWRVLFLHVPVEDTTRMSPLQRRSFYLFAPTFTATLGSGMALIGLSYYPHVRFALVVAGGLVMLASLFDRYVPFLGTDAQRAQQGEQPPPGSLTYFKRVIWGLVFASLYPSRWEFIPVILRWHAAYKEWVFLQMKNGDARATKHPVWPLDDPKIRNKLIESQGELENLWDQIRAYLKNQGGYLRSPGQGFWLIDEIVKDLSEVSIRLQNHGSFRLLEPGLANWIRDYIVKSGHEGIAGILFHGEHAIQKLSPESVVDFLILFGTLDGETPATIEEKSTTNFMADFTKAFQIETGLILRPSETLSLAAVPGVLGPRLGWKESRKPPEEIALVGRSAEIENQLWQGLEDHYNSRRSYWNIIIVVLFLAAMVGAIYLSVDPIRSSSKSGMPEFTTPSQVAFSFLFALVGSNHKRQNKNAAESA